MTNETILNTFYDKMTDIKTENSAIKADYVSIKEFLQTFREDNEKFRKEIREDIKSYKDDVDKKFDLFKADVDKKFDLFKADNEIFKREVKDELKSYKGELNSRLNFMTLVLTAIGVLIAAMAGYATFFKH